MTGVTSSTGGVTGYSTYYNLDAAHHSNKSSPNSSKTSSPTHSSIESNDSDTEITPKPYQSTPFQSTPFQSTRLKYKDGDKLHIPQHVKEFLRTQGITDFKNLDSVTTDGIIKLNEAQDLLDEQNRRQAEEMRICNIV